ncbi:MAG: hypothetical protein ACOYYS_11565 [Chloroflexota bacterium]
MKKLLWFASDLILGALIAILSVLTAFTSWQYSAADGVSSGYSSDGMKKLTEANAEYLVVNQAIIQDYTYFDTYYLNYETNPEVADYYQENFSGALAANMERDTPAFDDQYYEEMYQDAAELFDEADRLFARSSAVGQRSDRLQLTMLIFAVALSFTAWASLLDKASKLRVGFSLLAMSVMVAGIVTYLTAPAIPV